jgi:hypothetical protein
MVLRILAENQQIFQVLVGQKSVVSCVHPAGVELSTWLVRRVAFSIVLSIPGGRNSRICVLPSEVSVPVRRLIFHKNSLS